MAYSAKSVANEFLELAKKDGKQVTQMQLQKLVYFAYGWYLAITGERLIDERVEAWQWGPVVPSLYSEFKRFGSDPITDLAFDTEFKGNNLVFVTPRIKSSNPQADNVALQIIKRVWDIYGRYSASQLSSMTHVPNSPWFKTTGRDIRGTDISDKLIREYFLELARKSEQPTAGSTR